MRGLANCRAVPRTHDIWVGINRLRQMLPRFSFRIPQCERGLEALSNYHTIRETSTGIARDEPCHDWSSSHACDALRVDRGMRGGAHAAQCRERRQGARIAAE